MSTLQRRRWERYRVTLEVVIRTPDGRELTARTQDVCEAGLGVVCAEPLATGADCAFLVRAIDDLPLAGTVRWCTRSAALSAHVIGVELTALTERQTQALAERISRWKAESLHEDGLHTPGLD
jgi:PilZ domain-containing protein